MATNKGPRLSVANAKGCLAVLFLGACSSSSGDRDQNWGSDVGRDYDGSIASDVSQETPDPADTSDTSDTPDRMDAPTTSDDVDAGADTTPDVPAAETMDAGAMNAQDTVDSNASDGEV